MQTFKYHYLVVLKFEFVTLELTFAGLKVKRRQRNLLAIQQVSHLLADENYRLFAIDAINLLESGVDRLCDKTVAITSPLELRVRRIMARDNISEQYARLRISAQKPDEYYRGKCDCELTNAADTPEAFQADARLFFHRLVETIREEKRHGAN